MVMMTVWVVWKTRDSTKDLVLCGEKVLGEKAKEWRECVPYISISQMFIQLPQNHLGEPLKKNTNARTPSKDTVAQ